LQWRKNKYKTLKGNRIFKMEEEKKPTPTEGGEETEDKATDSASGARHLSSAERQRIYRERAAERRHKEAKAKKKANIIRISLISVAAALLVCGVVAISLLSVYVWMPEKQYGNALALYENGEYLKAYDSFLELGDFKDASEMAELCILKNAQALSGKQDVIIGTSGNMPWFKIDENGAIKFDAELYRGDNNITVPDVFDGVLVRALAEKAFEFYDEIKTITLPASVSVIGERAFFSCDSLEGITLSDNVSEIGNYAFGDCFSLTSVTLGRGVKTIGQRAFRNCVKLSTVTIPEGVESVGARAFNGCDELTELYLPSTLTFIGGNAFTGCGKLTKITYNGTRSSLDALCVNEDGALITGAKELVCTK
jgi:hypothetical protein